MCLLKSHDLQQIFEKLDRNRDGHVSVDELSCFLAKIDVHIGLEELESIMGRKSFDLEEFVVFCEAIYNKQGEEEEEEEESDTDLVEAFKVFDINNDGFISSDELQCVLSRLGLWEERSGGGDCTSMICKFDSNLDGLLDFEEFKKMMLMT